MNVNDYLKRINYSGPMGVDAETLRNLQIAHLRTVPFENLSIHSGEPIVLNDEALFRKIVENRRGGFCYELNGLFAWLLREIGFDVVMLSAGVAHAQGGFSPEFDHMALMINLDRRWLVDVGFGDSFFDPLLLEEDIDQRQGTRTFRIISADSHLVLMRRSGVEEWKPQYRFTLQGYEYDDYEAMCRYHQTSSESHFTKSRLCSLATSEGRITLSGMRLIKTSNDHRGEYTVENDEEYERLLKDQFGIVMKHNFRSQISNLK